MMTDAQNRHYWFLVKLWREARKERHQPAREEDRHVLHRKALGRDKSSKDFTNAEFDKVKAAFLAEAAPDNLNAQLAALEQPQLRRSHVMTRISTLMLHLGLKPGLESGYVRGIAKNLFHEDQYQNLDEQKLGVLEGVIVRRLHQMYDETRVAELRNEAAREADKVSKIIAPAVAAKAAALLQEEDPF